MSVSCLHLKGWRYIPSKYTITSHNLYISSFFLIVFVNISKVTKLPFGISPISNTVNPMNLQRVIETSKLKSHWDFISCYIILSKWKPSGHAAGHMVVPVTIWMQAFGNREKTFLRGKWLLLTHTHHQCFIICLRRKNFPFTTK